ncbi:MAG: sigma-70 family RNA polymerase sigma factor [Armatimonadota bacterium]
MQTGNNKKLSEEEIQMLLAQYSKKSDSRIRDKIVMQYTNLVESIARRFMGACEPLEDLIQEGYIGLIASVDKYDVDKGVKFSTYATHFIIGQIKHYLRDKGKIIKEPAWLQELNQRMTKVIESLNQKYNRAPTEKEIAEVMEMSESAVRDLLTTREVFKVSSLDGGDKDEESGHSESDKIKDESIFTFQLPLEDKIVLEKALDKLKEIEKHVIADHFYKGLNQTEIAKKLDISCNYVSHILRNGTKKLRRILTTEEIKDSQIQRSLISNNTEDEKPASWAGVLDTVTGLYNRDYFIQRLNEEVSRSFRDRHSLSVVMIKIDFPDDIDRMTKMVKQEDWLYNIAQSMQKTTRKVDLLARYGDTCFSLMLPHCSEESAKKVTDRLVCVIDKISLDSGKKSSKIRISCKTGSALYPVDATSASGLMIKAASEMGSTLELLKRDDYIDNDLAA